MVISSEIQCSDYVWGAQFIGKLRTVL